MRLSILEAQIQVETQIVSWLQSESKGFLWEKNTIGADKLSYSYIFVIN